jgi:hypothetical protein
LQCAGAKLPDLGGYHFVDVVLTITFHAMMNSSIAGASVAYAMSSTGSTASRAAVYRRVAAQ